MTYSEKLKDPRWQRKRLEVLERAGWQCENCGSETNELHVHHPIYVSGREPWEYTACDLTCLCVGCHEVTTLINQAFSGKSKDSKTIEAVETLKGFLLDIVKHEPKEDYVKILRTMMEYLARSANQVHPLTIWERNRAA